MDKEIISLQPEIIQFGVDQEQLIKVINRTNQAIENCFFGLLNTNKYQFSPDCFSLQPKQHKLISVRLKLKLTDGPTKQFAYLKSKNLNKRIILMNSPPQQLMSDQKFRSPLSGVEDINTLSTRDYKQQQKLAYNKVISQKEAYIQRLQRKLQQQQIFIERQRQFSSANKSNKFYLDQIHSLQLKVQLLAKQKQQLIIENIQLQGKFKQYRILMEADGRIAQANQKINECNKQIGSQAEQIKYLERQCEQYLQKISEKQTKIRQSQFSYITKIDNIIKQSQKKLQQMEAKIQQQRKQSQSILKSSKQQVQNNKQQLKSLQMELRKRQKQIKSLTTRLQTDKKSNKQQLEEEKKKSVKIQVEKIKLQQNQKQLKNKIKQLQKSYDQLKEQTIIYKSKMQDQDTSFEKLNQYLQMALESCKNENQLLRKSNIELQNNLNDKIKQKKQIQANKQILEQKINIIKKESQQLKQQNQAIVTNKIKQQQQSHDKLMKLKSENIELIQKLNVDKRNNTSKDQKIQQLNIKIKQLQDQIQKYQQQLIKSKQNQQVLKQKLQQTEQAKQKISKKIQKYRKQAKKQIRSIHDNAKDELKKIEYEKNQLQRKVGQLQISAHNTESIPFNQNQTRHKTRTHYEAAPYMFKSKCPMSLPGDRKTGIKNQRKQLEESNGNSRTQIDMDKIYSQLGQLREFKNYVNNQIRKLNGLMDLENSRQARQKSYDQNVSTNPIFSVINFFKELQQRLNSKMISTDKFNQAEKEVQFLKGRLTQLEPIVKKLKQRQKQPQQSISIQSKKQYDRNAIEYIRQQMKAQYKKLYDSLKISQEKYQLLRKKIYEQYRARIIQLISKKDKDQYTVARIEAVLQRFVEGLGNTSHKQAVLARQVKLKQQARRQASALKNKITVMAKQLEKNNRKGSTCIREPIRAFEVENQNQWLDYIKLQAKMLTYQAENARLNQQINLISNKFDQTEQQLKLCEADLQAKQQSIQRLKKQVITISTQSQGEISKQQEQLNTFKKKFMAMQKMQKQLADLTIKQKQNTHLRSQMQQKRQTIKQLRERLRQLQQLLDETRRNQSVTRDKQRKQYIDESRMQQSLRDLRDNNRQLRTQNQKLKQQIDSLAQDVNKKNAALKRLKSQGEQHRIKNVKSEQNSIQKLRSQIRQLKDEIKKCKEDADKQKRKKDREINEKQSEIDKSNNQFLIQKSSLESIIRALIDTMSGIYCSLDIIARKKGKIVSDSPNFDDLIKNPSSIKSTKIRQTFDEVIEALKQ